MKKICHLNAPYILGAATEYDGTVRSLVHVLKFQGARTAAKPLATALIRYVAELNIDLTSYAIVPMPLSNRRRRSRGFNQSQLIAELFANHFDLPLLSTILTRTIHKRPQSETFDIIERHENVRDCFALIDPVPIQKQNIVLLDDVTTSGTTFFEAARILRDGGARRVLALAVAKA